MRVLVPLGRYRERALFGQQVRSRRTVRRALLAIAAHHGVAIALQQMFDTSISDARGELASVTDLSLFVSALENDILCGCCSAQPIASRSGG